MADPTPIAVRLEPAGRDLRVPLGTLLREVLHAEGVEFPCGGVGRCRGCRVRVASGVLDPAPEDLRAFTPEQILNGWRLCCRARAQGSLTLDVAQWESVILADDSPYPFEPREGIGIAVDVGTTTLAAQLVDLERGRVLAVQTALNPQARFGADVMSRIDFALNHGKADELREQLRKEIGNLVDRLVRCSRQSPGAIREIVLVGNTVMHHLFCGLDTTPLAHHPYHAIEDGEWSSTAGSLNWCGDGVGSESMPEETPVRFLPCLGGFVGSDLLSGILATGMHQQEEQTLLVDLGTNGELVLGNRHGWLCASTAAGPAFEGARISCGMRADTGAVCEVNIAHKLLDCRVIGGGRARGICGSGLVDAVAGALDLGWIDPSGRFSMGSTLPLCPGVTLIQSDLRELQLAKAAIAAGIQVLLKEAGIAVEQLKTVWLAGAFGNYLNRDRARRIGLLPFASETVFAAGNTALRGAKIALGLGPQGAQLLSYIRTRTRHVPLNDHAEFMDAFVDSMSFPAASAEKRQHPQHHLINSFE